MSRPGVGWRLTMPAGTLSFALHFSPVTRWLAIPGFSMAPYEDLKLKKP